MQQEARSSRPDGNRSTCDNMRKNPTDRMKDPFYADLLFQIECMIHLADEEAKGLGVDLSDSQICSALIKTRKLLQGGTPDIPKASDREQVLARLTRSLYDAPAGFMEEVTAADGSKDAQPLQITHWLNAVETVLDSIKKRKSNAPGSRCYLSFLNGFVPRAWHGSD